MTKEANELASAERRNFLKLTGTGAFTAAMVAGVTMMQMAVMVTFWPWTVVALESLTTSDAVTLPATTW